MQGFIVTATKSRNKVHRDYWSTIRAESKDEAIKIAKRDTRGLVDIACYTHAEWDAMKAPPVSLEKTPAPVGVRILADVPQESNAVVMARAVAYVRDIRLTREYLEACAGDEFVSAILKIAPPEVVTYLARAAEDARLTAEYLAAKDGDEVRIEIADGGSGSWPFVVRDRDNDPIARFSYRADAEMFKGEKERALAAEQARADAARKLAGVALCARLAHEAGEQMAHDMVYAPVLPDDDDDNPSGFINHYVCPDCKTGWTDEWSCMVDDDCPECGARHISPFKSEDA